MRTISQVVYTAQELKEVNEKGFKKAYEKWLESFEQSRFIVEEYTDILKAIGFINPIISYSGFWSQGDGLSFTGVFYPNKDNIQKVIEEYPHETEAIELAKYLNNINESIKISIGHNSRYYHEYTMDIEILAWDSIGGVDRRDVEIGDYVSEDEISETLRNFAKHMYREVEKDYNEESSESLFIVESDDNNWEYLVTGELYQ